MKESNTHRSPFRPLLIGLAAAVVAAFLFGGGFALGAAAERYRLLPGSFACEPAEVAPTFEVFWETWDLVQRHYVDQTQVDPQAMTYGAIHGMLASLGDVGHTRFLSPEDLRAEEQALAGKLEGIGAEVTMRDGRPTIVAPIAGSPAEAAGIRPGDVIVRVDGESVDGLNLVEVVQKIRGAAGTTVRLTLLRAGEPTLTELEIVRAQITVPSVAWAKLPGTDIAHVHINQFTERTVEYLVTALREAENEGARGMILDLRNNPGGLLEEAVGTASQFLAEGNVLIEQDANGNRKPYPVAEGGVALEIPLVVLVNEGSASSAEIVAGALQDHNRARIIGTTTFGTGTVLSRFRLSDGSSLWLGTAQWFTPEGRQIWHNGIEPDIRVGLPLDVAPLFPSALRGLTVDGLRASGDAQLLRAVEELSAVPVAP